MNPGHKPPKLVCQHHERFTSFSCAVDDLLEEIQHSPAKDSQRIITTCVNCNFQVYVIQITRIPNNSWGRTSRHIEKTLLAPIPQVHDSVALLLKGLLHTAGSYYFKNVSCIVSAPQHGCSETVKERQNRIPGAGQTKRKETHLLTQ